MRPIPTILAAVSLAALVAAAPAQKLPEKGEPPISAQTEKSGGERPAAQHAMRFDHADLAIEVFPETRTLTGVATLSFTATAPLTTLVIDLDTNLGPQRIAIDGKPLLRKSWSNPDGQLTITLPKPIATGGKVTAQIAYGGTPHVAVRAPWDDGLVWSQTADGRPWIASTSEGYGCDLLWPCLDFPKGEPARVDLHITVPKGLKAPANGVLKGVETHPDGRTTWNWSARSPNPYSVALNIGPYEEISGTYKSRYGNTIPMFYWYLPGEEAQAKELFAEFAPTLDFYESVVGPYPFADEKVGVVETPHKGMEHQTINAYGNEYAKAPEGFDWLFQHEFGHEWFGNQLTAANWDDYWLHEGYESYMQPFYGRWREGEARYAAMMLQQRNMIQNQAPIVSGTLRTEEEVYEADKGGPGQDIYYKGSWMLHTLRNLIGDQAFKQVTQRAVYGRADPKPGNFAPRFGSTDEYLGFVKQVTGKDYGWFFNVYLRQAALPKLLQTRDADTLTLVWQAPANLPFPMPVEVQVDGKVTKLPMTTGSGTLPVPADAHVVVDPWDRILKQSDAIDAYQAYIKAQNDKRAAAKAD
ncbi:M1 family metallopeptidase [Hephaestia sp. GCM10023244]|uniref:M1 family metallopeptidase n=1 Tax=unclassified Hephaestia TaxID=2631281 RepID=UPI002076DC4A|nr:M1 family metallopeptidase [Hephaestia sp. MAHUQ-44]MCM8730346.1 M1 family metallopeptidase [Hephaestia sp. MAHUQ-44]